MNADLGGGTIRVTMRRPDHPAESQILLQIGIGPSLRPHYPDVLRMTFRLKCRVLTSDPWISFAKFGRRGL